jgi:hypothetical protein
MQCELFQTSTKSKFGVGDLAGDPSGIRWDEATRNRKMEVRGIESQASMSRSTLKLYSRTRTRKQADAMDSPQFMDSDFASPLEPCARS